MQQNTSLVITSISKPNEALTVYAKEAKSRGISFILIGDVASPADFYLEGCDFWDLKRQRELPYKLAKIIPERHYARKNIGYLIAKQAGASVIIETDDDNLPRESFWNKRRVLQHAHIIENSGWINIYKYFTNNHIWPRGYPLELLQKPMTSLSMYSIGEAYCPIQQGLADENPDVDAVYRMTFPLPQNFEKDVTLLLGNNSWTPFNSQNTTWFKDAFQLLYLPSFCSFRMTDIWRSFIAHRICWTNNWKVMFHGPTVWQDRNQHNLLKDFSDEMPGYLNNARICDVLEKLELKLGIANIPENMISCYRSLISLKLIDEKELPLLESWLNDMQFEN